MGQTVIFDARVNSLEELPLTVLVSRKYHNGVSNRLKIVFQVDYSHVSKGKLMAGPPVCKMNGKAEETHFFVLSHLLLAFPILSSPLLFFLCFLSGA